MAYGILIMLLSMAAAGHVLNTGRSPWWLLPIFFLPPLGAIAYAVTVLAPDLFGGVGAKRLASQARRTVDPGREYREAKAALAEVATVRNQGRLAAAAAALGRHDEAERLYREAAHGVHAEDPALLLGLATALMELGRADEALAALNRVGDNRTDEHTPDHTLARGRALDALGRTDEAESALRQASETVPGFEGQARYAAFLARHGRQDEARDLVADMDQRLKKLAGPFRKEARHWRDLAAQALAQG